LFNAFITLFNEVQKIALSLWVSSRKEQNLNLFLFDFEFIIKKRIKYYLLRDEIFCNFTVIYPEKSAAKHLAASVLKAIMINRTKEYSYFFK